MKNKTKISWKPILIIAIGITLLGIGLFFHIKELTKYRGITDSTFVETKVYSESNNGTTYTLLYNYQVNHHNYTYETNYGTAIIPKEKTIKKIRYNLDNPQEAYLVGLTFPELGIGLGLVLILGALAKLINKEKINSLLYGTLIIIISCMILGFITGYKNPLYFLKGFSNYGLVLIVPLFWFVIGLFICISPLLNRKSFKVSEKTEQVLTNVDNVINSEKTKQYFFHLFRITDVLKNIFKFLVISFILVLLFWLFKDYIFKSLFVALFLLTMFIIPLFINWLYFLYQIIKVITNKESTETEIKRTERISKILKDISTISFFIAWFVCLIFCDYLSIRDKDITLFIFSLLFWTVGIYRFYKTFKINKRKKK